MARAAAICANGGRFDPYPQSLRTTTMSWGLSAMPTLCIRDSRIAIEAAALPLGTPNAINEMSALLHMCRRFIEKQVNSFKGSLQISQNECALSSAPVPHRLPATGLRQVSAIYFVRPDILDEEINDPSPLAIFPGLTNSFRSSTSGKNGRRVRFVDALDQIE